MKPKRKPDAGPAKVSAAIIARLAKVSITRVNQLRAEGRTDSEIITGCVQRREELLNLPATPVNGHAANGTVSYAVSLAEKERWAAELRRIEVMEKRRELVPVAYVRHWGTNFLVAAKDEMLKAPSELRDRLAHEADPHAVERILDSWVTRVIDKLYRLETLWSPPPGPEAP
jgi:hypothetical protein